MKQDLLALCEKYKKSVVSNKGHEPQQGRHRRTVSPLYSQKIGIKFLFLQKVRTYRYPTKNMSKLYRSLIQKTE